MLPPNPPLRRIECASVWVSDADYAPMRCRKRAAVTTIARSACWSSACVRRLERGVHADRKYLCGARAGDAALAALSPLLRAASCVLLLAGLTRLPRARRGERPMPMRHGQT